MARHLQRHFTLPVIQPKAKEQILMNVLHALAREFVPAHTTNSQRRHGLYGLTRPSTDLHLRQWYQQRKGG